MRDLLDTELDAVSGAGRSPCPPKHGKKGKGNNGFGNGGDADPEAPGNSDDTPGDKDGSLIR